MHAQTNSSAPPSLRGLDARPWPIMVALGLTWVVVLADQSWVWGAVMVVWAARDVVKAETNFVQLISRRQRPLTYWMVVGSWMAMGVLWLA